MTPNKTDEHRMHQALRLSLRGLGSVAPNPSVGCVITDVTDNVIGTGWTAQGGRPHAETQALAKAAAKTQGGTAYITLEPCAHHGQTPPCSQALIDAKIARVFYAIDDPDPRVAGAGAAALQAANIKVHKGCGAEEAARINIGFLTRIKKGRASLTLKLAMSKNGFMRTPEGQSTWITGGIARRYGHLLRAQHDAIITGSGTLIADNPSLDCRLSGMAHLSPLPVVMAKDPIDLSDTKLSARALHSTASPEALLEYLAANHNVNAALLECGPTLARSFMEAGLVDAVALFEAPHDVFPPILSAPLQKSNSDAEYIGWRLADFTCTEDIMLAQDRYRLFYKHII